jgi:ribonuclease BN (tRNA processing enzyme)
VDRGIRREALGADLLIWDSQYTPEDYDGHRGWGHSTWLEGTRVAVEAGVKRLVLFHHDPQRSDTDVRRLEQEARRHFKETLAASEGLVISLP